MEANSLKELFQGLIPPGSAILQGTVTKDDPLEITAANDSKLVISGEQLIVPWHLTDYTTHADYTMGDKGELRDETYTKVDGEHQHVDSRGGDTSKVKHKHYVEKLNAYKMTLKVYTIITVAIMAVALVVVAACMIRLGYKALLAEWAIEAITKAEKEFVGTKLGEARLAVVVSWLRAKVPAPLRFLVTDSMIQKVVQMTFNAAKAGLEVLKDA